MKLIKADKYNIYIGNDVLSELSDYLSKPEFYKSKIFVLTDENTKKHCLPILKKNMTYLEDTSCLNIKSGEKYKTLKTSEQLWKQLISKGAERDSLLINLGGGVITDLGGFVASAFKRGIKFINIPTTLLSQVDASVGGKTGVDLDNIKNQVGFFSYPEAVFIYPSFLKTLPERELLSGYAEVIKHALIMDSKYWKDLILKTQNSKLKTLNVWDNIIHKSIQIKNKIVNADPHEQNIRKKLNFGHTIGHAIESLSMTKDKYPLLHGEAIVIGMICESYLSYKKTGLSDKELEDITSYIFSVYKHLKNYILHTPHSQLLNIMQKDKKNKHGTINFTLLNKIGTSIIDQVCSKEEITESLNWIKNFRS